MKCLYVLVQVVHVFQSTINRRGQHVELNGQLYVSCHDLRSGSGILTGKDMRACSTYLINKVTTRAGVGGGSAVDSRRQHAGIHSVHQPVHDNW